MQTNFTPAQLADPNLAVADEILRKCVHCGFCTATCPTYVLLGDEADSPRGRIYLMKEMFEKDKPASAAVTTHIDRCLSCLSCMTTCPSGVTYMHLVDMARVHIERTYARPRRERMLRTLLNAVLPYPERFRAMLAAARLARPFSPLLPPRLRRMIDLAPAGDLSRPPKPQVFAAEGPRRLRVALLAGCVQQVVGAAINAATVRLLTRHGCEVVVAEGSGCCGALTHHLGREAEALSFVKANIAAWQRLRAEGGLDAVVINASGCGTVVKDYGFMLRSDPDWAAAAAEISALTRDVTEVMAALGLKPPAAERRLVVAYHAACSLQHGQRIREEPKALLRQAGFEVRDIPEAHLCCGSAGTYNLLQPDIALQLRDRKVANIESVAPQVVAGGNIGCLMQIAAGTRLPVVHTVELLDWATGGPQPAALAG